MMILLLFAFLSGVVTILSPCILPVLPIILSGSVGERKKPYGIVIGFISSFTILSLTLSKIVDLINIPDNTLRIIAIIFLVVFGLITVVPQFKLQFQLLTSKLSNIKIKRKSNSGFISGILTGFSLGILWTPCVGPIMASVLTLIATSSADILSAFIILSYSIGTSIPMLIIILGGKKITTKKIKPVLLQRIMGVLMIVVGLSIAFDIDRKFQKHFLELFPGYGSGLTFFENSDIVTDALNKKFYNSSSEIKNKFTQGKLGFYGLAPDFMPNSSWLNSEELNLDKLKGKVVIIDFWTYSCVNCIRTLPYLSLWADRYKDSVVIVGIHTPEFLFERGKKNLKRAIKDLEISWPVVQDNNYNMWKAYNNRYWPSKYFIDVNGEIRYAHFGEGEYKKSEEVIITLLKEANLYKKVDSSSPKPKKNESSTPELYLGYLRGESIKTNNSLINDIFTDYIPVKKLKKDQITISGSWSITRDYIESSGDSELLLRYRSKDLFLVIEPLSESKIEIKVDGEIPKNSRDVKEGLLNPTDSRLYHIINNESSKDSILQLKIEGDVRLYAFTFG